MRMLESLGVRQVATVVVVTTVALAVPAARAGAQTVLQGTASQGGTQGLVLQLSMSQAVEMALEANLQLKASELSLDAADQNIVRARAAFLPLASVSLSRNSTESQAAINSDGTRTNTSTQNFTGGTSLSQTLPWLGSSYAVTWGGNRYTASGLATFNPQLGSAFTFSFDQPLWQGFSIDQNRATLEVSQRNRVITDLQVQQSIVELDTAVRFSYLRLISAIEQNKVANENMSVAEESLRQARARVEVGVAPEIEIVENEAQVEGRREAVISTEAEIQAAKDALRRLILDPARPDYWTVDIEPTDTISLTPPQIDVERATANALANRLDLQRERRNLEIIDLNTRVTETYTKPSVDLNLTLRSTAVGGTQIVAPGESAQIKYSTVLGDTFSFQYPSWTVGVNVGIPIGQTTAKAGLAQLRVEQRQQAIVIQDAELRVVEQVRAAARDVETSYRRVQALQRSREATERQLEAEERRFAVGLSTTFQLQSRQTQLFAARFAEVQAIIGYEQALINFERVQKIN
ncbi:MAG TPA: TolC family protein [Vicinamibacterales bacterium]|nr:TolC family protein [Vicinamibacterales bacterium]